MRARDIKPGHVLREDGELVYTVEAVQDRGNRIEAVVRHVDGGTALRIWDGDPDTPLTEES